MVIGQRAMVGAWPVNTLYLLLGHSSLDQTAAGNYAIIQDSSGATYLNAASSQGVFVRINNATMAEVDPDGNVIIGRNAGSVGGGKGAVNLEDANTVPTSAPSGGVLLYSEGGV